ncbi:2034_t:CDS:2, partial [Cetraspora pellucida]
DNLLAGIASLDDPDALSDYNKYSNLNINRVEALFYTTVLTQEQQAKEFGLEFTSITECNVIGGTYAGIFWSEGTGSLDLAEWLTDFSLQRIDARPFLFGEVHYGYYTNLFTDNTYASVKLIKQCPALRLAEAIRNKADEIYRRTAQPVKVWFSDYSPGGALTKLFYAQVLHSPTSL